MDDWTKGHDVILDAVRELVSDTPGLRWIVVGDGAMRSVLEARVKAAGLSGHVEFTGMADGPERDSWMRQAALFVMLTRANERAWGEGFGVAYLEAAAQSLPAVAGNRGGERDAVIDGETGRLVDPSDPAAVAATIRELLADPDRLRRMGAAARRHAEAHAWPKVAERVSGILRAVASGQGVPTAQDSS
jgi:phosphatidylinositol alpha-1,6-mannosyltransferase